MPPLLDVKGLHAGYGETRVLHGLDFVVDPGGVTTLLGANGAGKTTTLRAISGMLRISGDIVFGGGKLNGVATEAIAARGI
ncbi:MAG TPA: ATP-binding cassette domain-containing protein, partial [Acetobacteraceae bacterium]